MSTKDNVDFVLKENIRLSTTDNDDFILEEEIRLSTENGEMMLEEDIRLSTEIVYKFCEKVFCFTKFHFFYQINYFLRSEKSRISFFRLCLC